MKYLGAAIISFLCCLRIFHLLGCLLDPSVTHGNCSLGTFPCNNGTACLPQHLHCNGVQDCSDGADEDNCGNFIIIIALQFRSLCLRGHRPFHFVRGIGGGGVSQGQMLPCSAFVPCIQNELEFPPRHSVATQDLKKEEKINPKACG